MKYYEVWGWDTFAGESYFCGRYASLEKAEERCRKEEGDVGKTQNEELRDQFSITEMTENEILEREEKMEQIRKEEAKECRTTKST